MVTGTRTVSVMENTMEMDSFCYIIRFDPDIEKFRGEFFGLNGRIDFCAQNITCLR